jgi:hypothetical protein
MWRCLICQLRVTAACLFNCIGRYSYGALQPESKLPAARQLEQVQTAGPRNQTVHHAVHTSSSIGIATSCMRQVQQDTAASATALVCLHVSCPAGDIPAVSAGSEVVVNLTSRNQRDRTR